MTAPGVVEIPLVPPSREERLQAEVNELHAQLELARAQLAAGRPCCPSGAQEVVSVGGGIVAEADGWIWLVWRGVVYAVVRAGAEDIADADGVRERIRRQALEQQAKRGYLS